MLGYCGYLTKLYLTENLKELRDQSCNWVDVTGTHNPSNMVGAYSFSYSLFQIIIINFINYFQAWIRIMLIYLLKTVLFNVLNQGTNSASLVVEWELRIFLC